MSGGRSIGEDIYIKVTKNNKSYAFKASVSDVENVLDIVSTYVDLDKQSILNIIDIIKPYLTAPSENILSAIGAFEMPSVDASSLDIATIIELLNTPQNFNVSLEQTNNKLIFSGSYDQITAQIVFGEIIENASVTLPQDLSFVQVNVLEYSNIIAPTTYIDLKDLIKLYNATLNTIGEAQFGENFELAFSGEINLNLNGLSLNLPIAAGVKLENENISVYFSTEYKGIDVQAVFKNNTLFVDVANFKIQASVQDLQSVLEFVLNKLNNDEITQKYAQAG